ncbi:hypothetical protein [Crocosphaera sp.]|uniref:hypothetical protein n=1 Tax=Crocosphaera sp. TaxID=2729996 RepID=UPI00258027CB|nr:hypothetical protein [Crocosphaera sp.]NQZ65140.1 hypothetical protein [Crocosphaera sp.]
MFQVLSRNKYINMAITAVVTYYGGPWAAAAWTSATTYSNTGSLSAAFTAGATAYATAWVGGQAGLSGSEQFFASGVVGGVSSVLQGGKFGHGFISAGLGSIGGGTNPFARIAVSAIVGGTISKLTGGKFANGAKAAAFSALLSESARAYANKPLEEGSAEWEAREEKSFQMEQKQMMDSLATGKDLLAVNNSHWFESFIKEHGYTSLSVRGGFILAAGLDIIIFPEGISVYVGGGLGYGFSASGTTGISAGSDSSGWNSKTSVGGGFGAGGNATLRVSPQGVSTSVGAGTAWGVSVTSTIGYKAKIWDF